MTATVLSFDSLVGRYVDEICRLSQPRSWPFGNILYHCLYPSPSLSHSLSLPQAQRKMEVSKTASENADVTYRESVRNLEEGRNLWEREMEILCRVRSLYAREGGGGKGREGLIWYVSR